MIDGKVEIVGKTRQNAKNIQTFDFGEVEENAPTSDQIQNAKIEGGVDFEWLPIKVQQSAIDHVCALWPMWTADVMSY